MKNGIWDSEANKFTLYGAVFGLLFPRIATVIQAYTHFGTLTWAAIVEVQRTDPLLWIIDSAPFFLGRFAGWRQLPTQWRARSLTSHRQKNRSTRPG